MSQQAIHTYMSTVRGDWYNIGIAVPGNFSILENENNLESVLDYVYKILACWSELVFEEHPEVLCEVKAAVFLTGVVGSSWVYFHVNHAYSSHRTIHYIDYYGT